MRRKLSGQGCGSVGRLLGCIEEAVEGILPFSPITNSKERLGPGAEFVLKST